MSGVHKDQQGCKFLRPEDVRKLGSYEFAPRNLAEGYLSGKHRSKNRGASVEFHDYRQYVRGDDPAMVDWRVYARSDRHYIKTFEQETNMECYIFLDSSASMGFGENISKLEYASFFSAALSYLVVKNRDRISLLTFDQSLREYRPPGSTAQHLDQIMQILESNQPGNETSISEALTKGYPLLKRKATVVILSDFFDDPVKVIKALNPYIHRGYRIYLFHVLSPEELLLNYDGIYTFHDSESGRKVVVNTNRLRSQYRKTIQEHIGVIRNLARRRGIIYSLARTDTSFFELFDQFSN